MKSDREIYFEIRMVKNEIQKLKRKRYWGKRLSEKEQDRLQFLVSGNYWLRWTLKNNGD